MSADWLSVAWVGSASVLFYAVVVAWSNLRTVHLLKQIEKNTRHRP